MNGSSSLLFFKILIVTTCIVTAKDGVNIHLNIGQPMNITCFEDFSGEKDIEWKKNGINIASNDRITSYPYGLLQLKPALQEDADAYECLNIDDRRERFSLVYYDSLPEQRSVSPGEEVELTCYGGKKTPLVNWTRDGELLTDNTEKFSLLANGSGSALVIKDFAKADAGTFACNICFDPCAQTYTTAVRLEMQSSGDSTVLIVLLVLMLVLLVIGAGIGVTCWKCPHVLPSFIKRGKKHAVTVENPAEVRLQPESASPKTSPSTLNPSEDPES